MNRLEIEKSKNNLLALKQKIIHRLNLLDKDKTRVSHLLPESLDDQAVAIENDEVVNRLYLQDSIELRRIDQALKRIEMSAFGICVSCEGEISQKRLKAIPYAVSCIDCENSAH